MQKRAQVVVITGASAGVGRATARAFAQRGASIALLARDGERLEAARREVEDAGGRALVLPTDVAHAEEVEAAAERTERELGPIEVWVNNAMVSVFSPVIETTAEEFQRVTDVTYLGYVHGTRAALRHMLPRDRGVIVQVGSSLAHRGIPLQSAYCAAKHAVQGFTESLRCELAHDRSRIRVTMVHLPAVNTPQFDWSRSRLSREMQPIPPIFQPEIAAQAIEWASRRNRREVWVGWPVAKLILGNRLVPGYVDRRLARIGYDGQQGPELAMPRADNLWSPVPGPRGAHGRFDDRAQSFSLAWWSRKHAGLLGLVGLGALAALCARRATG